MKLKFTYKHLPGEHDQKTHTPKKYGFDLSSLSDKRLGVPHAEPDDSQYYDWMYKYHKKRIDDYNSEDWAEDWDSDSQGTLENIRDNLVDDLSRDLSKETGVDKKDIVDMINDWEKDPWSDNSLALQAWANDVVGGKISKYATDKLESASYTNDQAKVAQAIYVKTQELLSDNNITGLDLYRGVSYETRRSVPKGFGDAGGSDGIANLRFSPLSSWTFNWDNANAFTDWFAPEAIYSLVLSAHVPAARIFSLPMTGLGSPVLSEAIILGGVRDTVAYSWTTSGFE